MTRRMQPGRLGTLTLTVLICFGIAVGQPMAVNADDKLGDAAIGAVIDQLGADPADEQSEAPPPENGDAPSEPAADETAPDPASSEAAPATDGADGGADPAPVETASDTEPAPEAAASSASSTGTAPSDQAAASELVADTSILSAAQPAANNATQSGDNSERRTTSNNSNRVQIPSLAQSAASNVLTGGSALGETIAPISGSLDDDSEGQREGLQAADDNLRPATIAPTRNRENRENREGGGADDNGTVVVNSLSDAGDEGKVAVHGHLVAGTLCDGSQFWSLDGGGTVNANGVNLSANGGTALSDASAGNDNVAGGGGSAGNGGSANSSADGGIVVVDELVTGNNQGNRVTVGDQAFTGDCGGGVIDGGDVTTITNVNISADGGTALADASGGDDNTAFGDDAGAGNGGRANASADGGIVVVGSLILGNNEGNDVSVGGAGSGTSSNGCLGGGSIDGGTVRNETMIDISADGGLAVADASGGDDNIALGEDASAGNGGRARANADGGLILAGDIITGNNQGNSISVECGGVGGGGGSSSGRVLVNGGSVLNQTTISLNADGGTAIADASGGDGNVAGGFGADESAAGNGGRAVSNASGGVIQVGNIVSGNNTGNVIALGANFAPVPGRAKDHQSPDKMRTIQKHPDGVSKPTAGAAPAQSGAAKGSSGRATASVGTLPSTGTGPIATAGAQTSTLLLLAGVAALGAALMSQASLQHQRQRSFVTITRSR